MPWATAQAVYAILVRHLGLPETPEAERMFCQGVAHRKRFNLRHLGFEGDFWNEGGSPYPRVTCSGTALWQTIDNVVQATAEIAHYFRTQIAQGRAA